MKQFCLPILNVCDSVEELSLMPCLARHSTHVSFSCLNQLENVSFLRGLYTGPLIPGSPGRNLAGFFRNLEKTLHCTVADTYQDWISFANANFKGFSVAIYKINASASVGPRIHQHFKFVYCFGLWLQLFFHHVVTLPVSNGIVLQEPHWKEPAQRVPYVDCLALHL